MKDKIIGAIWLAPVFAIAVKIYGFDYISNNGIVALPISILFVLLWFFILLGVWASVARSRLQN